MSLETTVIIEESKLPTPDELQAFISDSMLDLTIDTCFDWNEHMGWLPCQYDGQDCGFELFTESFTPQGLVEEKMVTEEESKLLGNRSYVITFVTHFSPLDSLSAFLVSTCLAKLADGCVWEEGEPPFLTADEVYETLKSAEKEFLKML